ncbi:hypothetical protein U2388_15120, partial [Listeria monocytogenes]|uniref:hypothetical protein n=1 Tax=Listeria monocytogenes TaxID=1639 RepID=UPI002FDC043F
SAPSQGTSDVARVSVDSSFPYRICASRTSPAAVSCTDAQRPASPTGWEPLPASLGGSILTDPSDPDIVYGGSVLQFNR